jgi:hypothetical protein
VQNADPSASETHILNERLLTSMEMSLAARDRFVHESVACGMTRAAWVEAAVRYLAHEVLTPEQIEEARREAVMWAMKKNT